MSEPTAQTNAATTIDSGQSGKRRRVDAMEATTSKHLENNYFALLANDIDEECDVAYVKKFQEHVQAASAVKQTNTNNSKDKNKTKVIFNNNNKENSVTKNDKTKMPPINIFHINANYLIEFLKNGLKIKSFKIKEHKSKLTLQLENNNDFNNVKKHLIETKTKFFTFTPKMERPKTYVLKGLSADTDTAEIMEELLKHREEGVEIIKVKHFETKKSRLKNYNLPIFLVQVTATSNISKLKAIKTLLYRCISWEPLKREEIQQCRNCQGFFHSAANCYLPTKCVKCEKNHEKGKCHISKDTNLEKEKVFCVLCKEYGHPASYKGCPVYKQLKEKLKLKSYNLKTNKEPIKTHYTKPNTSYAEIARLNLPVDTSRSTANYGNSSSISTLEEIKNCVVNLTNHLISLQKQLEMQTERIDTLFNLIER